MQSLASAAASVAALGDLSALASFSDDALIDAIARATDLRRCSDQVSAITAAELARRCVFSLGDAGLARAGGFTSSEHMVQVLTGVPRQEAAKLINVGALMTSSDPVAVTFGTSLGNHSVSRSSNSIQTNYYNGNRLETEIATSYHHPRADGSC